MLKHFTINIWTRKWPK